MLIYYNIQIRTCKGIHNLLKKNVSWGNLSILLGNLFIFIVHELLSAFLHDQSGGWGGLFNDLQLLPTTHKKAKRNLIFLLQYSPHEVTFTLGLPSGLCPFRPIETPYTFLFSSTRATWPANPTLLDLTTHIIFMITKNIDRHCGISFRPPVSSTLSVPNI